MADILDITTRLKRVEEEAATVLASVSASVDFGGGPPHDWDMEARVTALEKILPTLATKTDVRLEVTEAKADVLKWGATIAAASVAIIITTLGIILSRIVPAPTNPPAPIVIQVPAPVQAAPQAPPPR